jgi:NADPH2 dehydrogenase
MLLTQPYQLKNLTLANRLVMPPMCMYQAKDGFANNFHFTHYTNAAFGKVGLIIQEASGVTSGGRITDYCLGIWDDKFIPALKEIVDEVHRNGAKMGIQLIHAGRKSEVADQAHVAPSAIRHSDHYPVPEELTTEEIHAIVLAFGQAAARAEAIGYDVVEIHGAHGYLIHQFMSPLSNHRTDPYGGSTQNRGRFLREIVDEVRKHWPSDKVLQVRVSASDYDPEGLDPEEVCRLLDQVKDKIDLVHVSSGGNVNRHIQLKPGYQVDFADTLKHRLGLPVIAVGLITDIDQAESILTEDKADLVALGRELLRNPYWMFQALAKDNKTDQLIPSYARAFR